MKEPARARYGQGTLAADVDTWIREARAGSRQSLDKIFTWAGQLLLAGARRQIPPGLQAKASPADLVQQVLLKAYTHFDAFLGNTGPQLLAWLEKILDNECHNLWHSFHDCGKAPIDRETSVERGLTRTERETMVSAEPSPAEVVVEEETESQLWKAVARLPERLGQVLRLHYQEGCSLVDVGKTLGCTDAQARKLHQRALDMLAHLVPQPNE